MGETTAARMGGREWAMLIALSVAWGLSFFFVGVAVLELPPLTIVALRVALAAAALLGLLAALGRPIPRDLRLWAAFVGMGALNNAIPFSLITWGQTEVASGLAAILNAATPVSAVLVAHALTRDEKLTGPKALGVGFGVAGAALIIGPEALTGLGGQALGQLAILAATVSYALAGVFGRRFRRLGVDPIVAAAGQLTGASLILVPAALAIERSWLSPAPGGATVAALLGLALVSTALAYILYFRILATAGATNVLLVTLLVPVSAVLLGAAALGERLEWIHAGGMALIALGLGAIDGRPLAWLRRAGR